MEEAESEQRKPGNGEARDALDPPKVLTGLARRLANLRPYPPGVSGNRKGRPPKRTVFELVRKRALADAKALAEKRGVPFDPRDELMTIAEAYYLTMVSDRNVAAFREFFDREFGPVVQRTQVQFSVLDRMREEHERWVQGKGEPRDVVAEVQEQAELEIAEAQDQDAPAANEGAEEFDGPEPKEQE